ncbi:hypothetical protein D3879_16880 [Pseudomonas cavernicola]|uniref:Chemotaxis protein n=1 Tax=Pseudomonas cavernicola TaxID=2320866 RepID=A0A418XB58_9PSED|nr:hypothetical protein [Pseudomonas cavernicola]RJG09742.1 hypothetical protein D3879_16880 [Pseudomonas cavernicola]
MEDLIKNYTASASIVLQDNEALAAASSGLREIFSRSVINEHKEKVRNHFQILLKLDEQYTKHLSPQGTINELSMKSAQIQILSQARSMFVGAIKNYESSLTELEGQFQFKVSTTLAIVAILISILLTG